MSAACRHMEVLFWPWQSARTTAGCDARVVPDSHQSSANRGTFESADAISDLVARPVFHSFSSFFKGQVHDGMLKAALYVVGSIWQSLNQALLLAPNMPVLVTGGDKAGPVSNRLRFNTITGQSMGSGKESQPCRKNQVL